MSQPWDKILLYEDRSVSQCIEATFDFMRQNRRVWLLSAVTLLLPPSILLGLSAFTVSSDGNTSDGFFLDLLFKWQGAGTPFFFAVLFIGVWMAYVHAYALLTTYNERGGVLDGLSQRQLLPAFWHMALRSFWLAAVAFLVVAAVLLSANLLTLLLVVVMVPLSLLPSVFILERVGFSKAFRKSFRLGFRAFFQLVFTIGLMMLFGFFMTMVIDLPSSLFDLAFGALSNNDQPFSVVTGLFSYLFTVSLYFGFFIVISMTLMAAAYQYGTVSERIDDASLEGDIQHFEQL